MKKTFTRRSILGMGTALGIGMVGKASIFAAPPKDEDSQEEIVLVGPILLSELYETQGEKEDYYKRIERGGGPDYDGMLKEFKECRVFIIDKRVRPNKESKWELDRSDDFPKVVLEGKTSFKFKLKDKQEFKICINCSSLRGTHTHITESPFRQTYLLIQFDSSPYLLTKKEESEVSALGFSICTLRLRYDHTGKLTFPETKDDKER